MILDVGCADNPQGDINIDVTLYYNRRGRSKVQLLGDGLALPFKDAVFSLVRAEHVIEHVTDPYAFLSELSRVSRRYVYIACPNPHNWRVVLKDHLDTGSQHYYQGHSARELRAMMEAAGLRVLQTGYGKTRRLDRVLKWIPRLNKVEVQILGVKG